MSQKRQQNSPSSQRSKKEATQVSHELENLDDFVDKCVRFFVLQMGSNVPIPRQKLIQLVFKDGSVDLNRGGIDVVVKRAGQILSNVYGVELQVLESETSSVKKYVLVNKLAHIDLVTESPTEDFKGVLTSLVLAHIIMSKGICTERSLWTFLELAHIRPSTKVGTDTVENYILKTMTKEQIICFENKVSTEGDVRKKIRWGSNAEQTMSKHTLLKYYSEAFDGLDISSWAQYEDADLQNDVEVV